MKDKVKKGSRIFLRVVKLFSRTIIKMILIGIILNLDSEFPTRFPTIYGICDGMFQVAEFFIKAILKGWYSFFTGQLGEFWIWNKYTLQELLQQFVMWISAL